jgi:hypothetical protein
MSMIGIVVIILVVAALIIAIWSAVKPQPVLWIAVVLLAIAVMVDVGSHLTTGAVAH